jgi:hypothetical protein
MKVYLVVCFAVVVATCLLSARCFIKAQRKAREDSEIFLDLPQPNETVLLEIYRQKYLNFRHFDTLRWGVHTVVITAGGLLVTFAARTTEVRHTEITVLLLLFGFFAGFSWFLLYRIAYNQMKNSIVLRSVAREIGDLTIPEVPTKWRLLLWSAAFVFMAFVGTLGSLAIVTAFFWRRLVEFL